MKRLLCLVLSLLLIFAGCSQKQTDTVPTDAPQANVGADTSKPQTIGLCYNKAETLSPLAVTSPENKTVMRLMYNSLFTVDDTFSVSAQLVESYTYVGGVLTLKLINATFHNGKPLTADDVIYTFGMLAGTQYSYVADKIVSIEASSDRQVIINLNTEVAGFYELLTFPILSSDGAKDNGTGPYILSGDTLTQNKNYFSIIKGSVEQINLFAVDSEQQKVDLFNDDSVLFLASNLQLPYADIDKTVTVDNIATNTLTYLGLNTRKGKLTDSALRQAINIYLDRNRIAQYSDGGACYVTNTAVNPRWELYSKVGTTAVTYSMSPAKMLDNALYQAHASGNRMSLTLAVNQSNFSRVTMAREIARQLEDIGITVDVSELNWNDYSYAVKNRIYDMFLGGIDIRNNMDLSALVGTGNYFGYDNEEVALASSKLDSNNLAQFMITLENDAPFVPLLFDQVQVMSKKSLNNSTYDAIIEAMNYK